MSKTRRALIINTGDDLEAEANRLIKANGGFGSAQGILSDRQLRYRQNKELSIEDVYVQARLECTQINDVPASLKAAIVKSVWSDLMCVLNRDDAEMVLWMRDGLSTREMAEKGNCSERSIRYRRQRLEQHVRAAADPYWPVWMIDMLIEVFTARYLKQVGRI